MGVRKRERARERERQRKLQTLLFCLSIQTLGHCIIRVKSSALRLGSKPLFFSWLGALSSLDVDTGFASPGVAFLAA